MKTKWVILILIVCCLQGSLHGASAHATAAAAVDSAAKERAQNEAAKEQNYIARIRKELVPRLYNQRTGEAFSSAQIQEGWHESYPLAEIPSAAAIRAERALLNVQDAMKLLVIGLPTFLVARSDTSASSRNSSHKILPAISADFHAEILRVHELTKNFLYPSTETSATALPAATAAAAPPQIVITVSAPPIQPSPAHAVATASKPSPVPDTTSSMSLTQGSPPSKPATGGTHTQH